MAKQVYISDIKEEHRALKLTIYEKAEYEPASIAPFVQKYRGSLALKTGANPYFLYYYPKGTSYEGEALIHLIIELLDQMKELIPEKHALE